MDENKNNPIDDMMKELEKEQDTLSQVAVVARIMNDVSAQYEKYFKRMWAVLIASIIANLLIVGAFLWYESQWETTTTTTTTVEQDTGTGSGNNVYQSGESAQYHESQKDGVNDGEAEDNNGNNDNQETQDQK